MNVVLSGDMYQGPPLPTIPIWPTFFTYLDCGGGPIRVRFLEVYTVKKVIDFPVPSRDVTDHSLSGRE